MCYRVSGNMVKFQSVEGFEPSICGFLTSVTLHKYVNHKPATILTTHEVGAPCAISGKRKKLVNWVFSFRKRIPTESNKPNNKNFHYWSKKLINCSIGGCILRNPLCQNPPSLWNETADVLYIFQKTFWGVVLVQDIWTKIFTSSLEVAFFPQKFMEEFRINYLSVNFEMYFFFVLKFHSKFWRAQGRVIVLVIDLN